jgi:hypothetical protein
MRRYFRTFSGRRYLGSNPMSKAMAIGIAPELRRMGLNARVIPTSQGYRIYMSRRDRKWEGVGEWAREKELYPEAFYENTYPSGDKLDFSDPMPRAQGLIEKNKNVGNWGVGTLKDDLSNLILGPETPQRRFEDAKQYVKDSIYHNGFPYEIEQTLREEYEFDDWWQDYIDFSAEGLDKTEFVDTIPQSIIPQIAAYLLEYENREEIVDYVSNFPNNAENWVEGFSSWLEVPDFTSYEEYSPDEIDEIIYQSAGQKYGYISTVQAAEEMTKKGPGFIRRFGADKARNNLLNLESILEKDYVSDQTLVKPIALPMISIRRKDNSEIAGWVVNPVFFEAAATMARSLADGKEVENPNLAFLIMKLGGNVSLLNTIGFMATEDGKILPNKPLDRSWRELNSKSYLDYVDWELVRQEDEISRLIEDDLDGDVEEYYLENGAVVFGPTGKPSLDALLSNVEQPETVGLLGFGRGELQTEIGEDYVAFAKEALYSPIGTKSPYRQPEGTRGIDVLAGLGGRKYLKAKPVAVEITQSNLPNKKLKAVFTYRDGRKSTTHFGGIKPDGTPYSDYTIHKDPARKKRYINRHKKNEDWSDPTTAGALSRYILWGEPDLESSIKKFKRRFNLA